MSIFEMEAFHLTLTPDAGVGMPFEPVVVVAASMISSKCDLSLFFSSASSFPPPKPKRPNADNAVVIFYCL